MRSTGKDESRSLRLTDERTRRMLRTSACWQNCSWTIKRYTTILILSSFMSWLTLTLVDSILLATLVKKRSQQRTTMWLAFSRCLRIRGKAMESCLLSSVSAQLRNSIWWCTVIHGSWNIGCFYKDILRAGQLVSYTSLDLETKLCP